MLDLLIEAMSRLDRQNGERQNVIAFIESCYCGRVRTYDLDAAKRALAKLDDEEQYTLIAWVVASDDKPARNRTRA
jgi:hypothetical protein